MKTVRVFVKKENAAKDLPLPSYQTPGSSGLDLYCVLQDPAVPVWIAPQETKFVSTGISISLPEGYEAQVRPRSGLALKHGITLLNAPGTIDSDYRGVISVIVINHGKEPFKLTHGLRIAQMIIAPVSRAELEVVETLDETVRAGGGFGHTGFTS